MFSQGSGGDGSSQNRNSMNFNNGGGIAPYNMDGQMGSKKEMSGGVRSTHVRHDMDQPIKVRQPNQFSYMDQQNIDFYGAYDEYPN